MALSDAQLQWVRPHVSSLEGDVVALRGLPERIVARLFEVNAAGHVGYRVTLAGLLEQNETRVARAAWGREAEHGTVHLGLENLSIVLARHIERRPGVRAVAAHASIDEEAHATIHAFDDLPAVHARLYRETTRQILVTYFALADDLAPAFQKRERADSVPRPTAGRERALEALAGLLPAGMRTRLGLTLDARSLAALVADLGATPLAEAHDVASRLALELEHVLPGCPLPRRPRAAEFRARITEFAARAGVTGSDEGDTTESYGQRVRLVRHDSDGLARFLQALVYEGSDAVWNAPGIAASIARGKTPELEALARSALAAWGDADAHPALAHAGMTFEIAADVPTLRALEHAASAAAIPQRVTCLLGAEIPAVLEELGAADAFRRALTLAEEAWTAIAATHPWQAEYVVPLAYRTRALWTLDLQRVVRLVQTTKARASEPRFARAAGIVHGIAREASGKYPWLGSLATSRT